MKWFIFLSLISIFLLITSTNLVDSTSCYVSLGTDHKWNDNGESLKCRADAKAKATRLCIKFKTDSRPGKIYRDCDNVYEKLFGYNVFRSDLGVGCRNFQGTTVDGGSEKGMYCYCLGDNCNTGDVPYPPRNTTTVVDICSENASSNLTCSYGTINIISAFYGRPTNLTCPLPPINTLNCSLTITDKVTALCQGKPECTVVSSYIFAGSDPCGGTTKYTEVVYNCNWNV